MAKVQRVGDQDEAGGKIIQGENSVRVNGKPIAVTNKQITPHLPNRGPKDHKHARTEASKNTTVKANGKLIVVTGDTDTCGHKRVGGSPNVNIG